MLQSMRFLCCLMIIALTSRDSYGSELPVVAPESVGMSSAKLKAVGPVVAKLIEQQKMMGASVMVARKGKVCFFETYGAMDVERDKPLQKDTIFRIYSMSKVITTAAVMQLVEQGKLAPEAPVSKYLPAFAEMTVYDNGKIRPAKTQMTIKDLMTHTSGLVYGAGGEYGELIEEADAMNRANTLEEMVNRMGRTPLKFDPGSDWAYGTSIDVLGRIVEVVSEQPFDDYLKAKIFKPLGMKDTDFSVPQEKVERFAANYNPGGKLIDDPGTSRYLSKPKLLSGGGGLVGTISDYMRFLMALQNGGEFNGHRILEEETVQLMTQNHVDKEVGWIKFGQTIRDGIGFGYGFSICVEPSQFDADRKVGDYGWGGAASTHYWISPEDDLIVVTMEQTMPYSFILENKLKPVISGAVLD